MEKRKRVKRVEELSRFEELHAEILKASGLTAYRIEDDLGSKIFTGWCGDKVIIKVSL